MATLTLDQQLQKQQWETEMQKDLVFRSVWRQLSNRVNTTEPLQNAPSMDTMPDAVAITATDKWQKGSQSMSIPFMGKLNEKGVGGRQRAKGREETPDMRWAKTYYNVKRKPIALEEESVDGDLADFYKVGSHAKPLIQDYFVELDDYDHARAIVEKGDEYLTAAEYWNGRSITSPPMSVHYHPNILINGKASLPTYAVTNSTYETTLNGLINDLTAASNVFDLTALNRLIFQMQQRLIPLRWRSGNEEINFIVMLSQEAADQLVNSASSAWLALMRDAEKRGVENRAISGVLGVYRHTLLIINQRQPIWNTAGSAGAYVAYHTPWSNGGLINSAGTAVPRTAKAVSGDNDGTCEITFGLGKGAVGVPEVESLVFVDDEDDYDFFHNVCGRIKNGVQRMDFDVATQTASSWWNKTSLLYITASPSVLF